MSVSKKSIANAEHVGCGNDLHWFFRSFESRHLCNQINIAALGGIFFSE
nr:MAG TPA: hypothetical protein [Caudoviricetes sp.]